MTLKNILALVNQYDKISIHNEVGYVLFDGEVSKLSRPVTKKILNGYLNHPVGQIRPCCDTLIVLLDFAEAK